MNEKTFIADIAHDLRTPLSIIKTDMELALRNPDISRAELEELAKSTIEEVNRMAGIIDNLVLFAKNLKEH